MEELRELSDPIPSIVSVAELGTCHQLPAPLEDEPFA